MVRMLKDKEGKTMTWKGHAFVKDADEKKKKPKTPKKKSKTPPKKKKKKGY